MKTTFLLPVLLLVLTGCGSLTYNQYAGSQKDLPHSNSSFIHTVEGFPIYHGYPSTDYLLLGELKTDNVPAQRIVSVAKANHAQALILLEQNVIQTGAVHVPEQTHVQYQNNTFGTVSPNPYVGTFNSSTYGSATATTTPAYDIPVIHRYARFWAIQFPTNSLNLTTSLHPL